MDWTERAKLALALGVTRHLGMGGQSICPACLAPIHCRAMARFKCIDHYLEQRGKR